MSLLGSGKFWIGVVAGAVVVPVILKKVAPSVSSKLPGK